MAFDWLMSGISLLGISITSCVENYWWYILDSDRSSDTVLYVQYSMWSFSMSSYYSSIVLLISSFITLEKIVRTDLIDFDVFMIDVGGTIVFPDFVCRTRRLVSGVLWFCEYYVIIWSIYIEPFICSSNGSIIIFIHSIAIYRFFFAFYLPSLGEVLLNVLEVSHTASKVYSHMEPVFSHGPQSMSEILVRSKIW